MDSHRHAVQSRGNTSRSSKPFNAGLSFFMITTGILQLLKRIGVDVLLGGRPSDVELGACGEIIASDENHHWICVFSPDGDTFI